jgi:multiple sugar transport system permease protein
MLPGALLAIPLYVIFFRIRLVNNLFSLVIANVAYIIPFGTWMMKGFFDTIPYELEEAAHIDGCSILGSLWKVTFPLSAPGLAATAIYCAIMSWSEFLFAKTFMSGGPNLTLTVGATTFIGEMKVNWNDLMAVSLLGTIPLIIAFVWLEKYLVTGLTGGAIK